MTTLLLCIFMVVEIAFCVRDFRLNLMKKEWSLHRFSVNGLELGIYLVMMILPGIDFSFRFKGLFFVLLIRIFIGGFFFLVYRNSEKRKKRGSLVSSAIFSMLFLMISMVPAFIFHDYKGRPVTGSYKVVESETVLIDKSRVEAFEDDGSFREVPVHFYYPEGIEGMEEQSLPLVIFSHGAFGYYQSNTSTYMELASHGYVVASLDHPYHSFFTKDSDGKTILVNLDFIQTAMRIGNSDDEISEEEIYEITSKWMELREADMNFVIDTLKNPENLNSIETIVKAINRDKIGLIGHSLGGATAVTVGRRQDISAVVDLDGTMLGEEIGVENGIPVINEDPYTTPLLNFDKESHYTERIKLAKEGYPYVNNVILEHATCGYSTYFKGAEHMDFTDLPLFSPFLANNLGSGKIDHEKCIDTVNQVVLKFFDYYLKDQGEFSVQVCY